MIAPLHILAYARNERGADAATLIFRTLRTGFPTAKICVHGNGLPNGVSAKVQACCHKNDAVFVTIPSTSHDAWIESLILNSTGPVWIADTDIVLWNKVEDWFQDGDGTVMAGRYEGANFEPWCGCNRPARLHTCLMFLNGPKIREAMRREMCKIPPPWRASAQFALIRQTFIPQVGKPTLFYDSTAGLFQAIGGTVFTEEQDRSFDHLHAGCHVDLASPHLGVDLAAQHKAVYADISLARGIKATQDNWQAQHPPKEIYG